MRGLVELQLSKKCHSLWLVVFCYIGICKCRATRLFVAQGSRFLVLHQFESRFVESNQNQNLSSEVVSSALRLLVRPRRVNPISNRLLR